MRILKVLIAEADPLLQKLYSDLIASEQAFTVLKCVSSGTQMFDSMRCVEADLVLLDLYLKDFNALEGLEELRKEFPKTDYIVASSGEDPNLVR
ncbi:MAG: response regulator, partial [Synergistaceae bacterium]|nr:response regulator [Synergistaceae bacterium]